MDKVEGQPVTTTPRESNPRVEASRNQVIALLMWGHPRHRSPGSSSERHTVSCGFHHGVHHSPVVNGARVRERTWGIPDYSLCLWIRSQARSYLYRVSQASLSSTMSQELQRGDPWGLRKSLQDASFLRMPILWPLWWWLLHSYLLKPWPIEIVDLPHEI